MKKLLFMSLIFSFSNSVLAAYGDLCHPGERKIESAALALSRINNPDGDLSIHKVVQVSKGQFNVTVDDNYGYFDIEVAATEASNHCRITKVIEK